MQNIKSQIFNFLTKSQKSQLCHYLSLFSKKHFEFECEEIAQKFLDEENYYVELGSSRYSWIEEYLNEEEFFDDLKRYIGDCIFKLKQKEKQRPYIEKQKELAKEQRKKASEFKMSKEEPTKKQKSYYKALCKKYKIEPYDIEGSSKLDLKNAIDTLLNENFEKEELLKKLKIILEKPQ